MSENKQHILKETYIYESKHKRRNHIQAHSHDYFQVLYALDGEGEIIIDGENYKFSKDQVVFIIPNSTHSIKADYKLTTVVLAFSESVIKHFLGSDLLTKISEKSHYYSLDTVKASDIRQILRKLLFEQNSYDSYCKISIQVYLMELLILLLRLKTHNVCENANDKRSIQLQEYIDNHYYEYITLDILSDKFNLSPRYVNEIFKTKFHETPLKYLQKVRINHAKKLLVETDKDIISICFEVGYETLSTFYRVFRNITGMSPHKYRTIHFNDGNRIEG